jgi:hypothetical protein
MKSQKKTSENDYKPEDFSWFNQFYIVVSNYYEHQFISNYKLNNWQSYIT